ncbi:tastin isoform X1 [Astyanax mexicanus]|uniref:Tastin isoform X1 n=1 Tax=Astyanax mexicanus TaxID=7994 RepID=A0A8B9GW63_ASTMX|nr:tastin isoform X1 [Astyanax mexicanus]
MASSAALLCPQNQNQRDNPGLLKHQKANKLSENLRTQSHITQSSKRGSENQDPNETAKTTKGANKLKTISRLPVLAKSIQPVLTDIPQSPGLKRWEERPLLGKAQKRKTCTKPVPFNLSQSRSHSQKLTEAAPERAGSSGLPLTTHPTPSKTLTTSQHRTNPPTHNPLSSLRNTHVHHTNTSKTKPLNPLEPKTSPKPKPNSTQSVLQCVTDSSIQRDLSSQLRSITLAQSELTKDPGLSLRAGAGGVEERAAFQLKTKGCIQTALSAKRTTGITGNSTGSTVSFTPDPSALSSILQNEGVKLDGPGATPRVSTCPTGRGTSIYSAQRVPVKKPQTEAAKALPGQAGSAVPFSPDPSALRSILLNEGIKAGGPVGATPRVSTCPSGRQMSMYSAQRVPLKKPQTEAAAAQPGQAGSAVPFSPDPSALRSILLNEGIKAGGASGATPRVSTCPSGRGTSIYSAQRVPLKKPKAEGTVAEAHTGASRTPNTKRTQQRVPYSQSQSLRRLISARKAALSNLQSPALREAQSSSTDSSAQQQQQQQKDVVQKLFQEEPEQEEHEQMEEEGDEAALGPALERQPTAELHSDKENMVPNNQPFIQAPHRQSVIVFSSGQRLFRPGPTQDCSQISENAGQLQPCVSSTESQSTEPVQPVQPSGSQSSLNSDTSKRSSPSTQCKTKASSSLSSAVCALRRRLPPLEEMFLDEECATYTSCQQAWPTQPRCSNPVASILLFQDSTCFMPIGFGSSSHSPGPLLSSPIR